MTSEKIILYSLTTCPCRPVSGNRVNDRDIICPCVYCEPDIKEYGSCYFSLYVSVDWYKGKIECQEVPVRRPPELYENE